ncbi:alpha/beta hydrolase [Serpentinicella alkaliphila]|nr:alpha/beta hydrolase [Serpentinicella alkaliphila]
MTSEVVNLIIIFSILLILLVISLYFSSIIIYPKTIDHHKGLAREIKLGRINEEDFNSIEKEEVIIKSPFNYSLFGLFFNNNSNKTVIICHGISLNLYSSIKYLPLYYIKGFNVLVYDHRNHGKSGGKTTTYGYYEKYDLKACVDWVKGRYGPDALIGIHGESMGAATVIQYAALEDVAAFYVVDCPYSDLKSELVIRSWEDYMLPKFPIINICNLINKVVTGVFFEQVSPINEISKIKTPMLFIHGALDKYVPTEMTIDLFNKKNGLKELYIAPNSGHVESYSNNKDEYNLILDKFLKLIKIN